VLGEFQIADHFRAEEADDVGEDGKFEARENLLGHGRPANEVAAFKDEDFFPCFGEVGGGGQAVVACADDEGIVVICLHRKLSRVNKQNWTEDKSY